MKWRQFNDEYEDFKMNTNKPDYCPDWFDLELYKNLENFNRSDWAISVFARKLAYDDLKERKPTEINAEFERWYLSVCFAQIRMAKSKQSELKNDDAVSLVDYFDVLIAYEDLFLSNDLELQSTFDEVRNEILKNKDEFSKDYKPTDYLDILNRDGINKNVSQKGDLVLSISLGCSDDVILEEIKKQLSIARSKYNDKNFSDGKRISDNEMKSLIENRIIPYIDLMIWGKITGKSLTQAQIANLLFPDLYDVDIVAKLRQTTIKKAMNLLSLERPKFI